MSKTGVSGAMPRDYRIGLGENECFDQLAQIRRTTTQNMRSNRFSLGRGCCVCTRQVAVEERPPPLPNGVAQLETPARTPASRTDRYHHSDANRFGMSPKLLIGDAAGVFDDPQPLWSFVSSPARPR